MHWQSQGSLARCFWLLAAECNGRKCKVPSVLKLHRFLRIYGGEAVEEVEKVEKV